MAAGVGFHRIHGGLPELGIEGVEKVLFELVHGFPLVERGFIANAPTAGVTTGMRPSLWHIEKHEKTT